MTPKRFETLADAWGGDVARWPDEDREAASALMAADPAWAEAILARANDLDAALAAYDAPLAPAGLADRIIDAAPRAPAPPPRWMGWLLPAGMGVGLAAACAAGVVMGVAVSEPTPYATVPDGHEAVVATAEDDFSFDFDEEIG